MKKLIEGKDYSVHEYVTKNKKENSKQPMCPVCSNCTNRNVCLNRKTLYTMNRCEKCKNCKDKDNCDKFYIYVRYNAELLNLGKNATTGETIRKQFKAQSREKAFQKLKEYYEKIQECGIEERIYKENEFSIVAITTKIEKDRLKKEEIKPNSYVRLMETIKTLSTMKFSNIPIQKVTKNQIVAFLESERYKSNSVLKKEYREIKKAFDYACYKKIITENYFDGYERIKCPKSFKLDSKVCSLTRKEEYALTEHIKTHDNKYNLIILLALYTRNENRRDISFATK